MADPHSSGATARPVGRTGNRRAAWTLVALAPIIAESTFSTPITYAWLVLLWLPIYGGGILLIRELVARSGRGWPSIVIMGIAYEILEDGIGLQALSSPHLYGAAEWGARVLGLNLPYWEMNAIYHVIFSALIPILLTKALFPASGNTPYLKNTGLVVTAVVTVLGVAVLRLAVPPTQDPGYTAPVPVLVGAGLAVAVLAVVALKIVPRRQPRVRVARAVPRLWTLALIGGLGTIAVLGPLVPLRQFGAEQPAFTHGWWVFAPMGISLLLAVLAYFLIRHWSASEDWSLAHAVALATGAVVAHTLIAIASVAAGPVNQVGLGVMVVIEAVLGGLLARHRAKPRTGTPIGPPDTRTG